MTSNPVTPGTPGDSIGGVSHLGTRIRDARTAAGLSRRQLAIRIYGREVGVDRVGSVNRWESGATIPNVNTLTMIARATGVTLDQLITEPTPTT